MKDYMKIFFISLGLFLVAFIVIPIASMILSENPVKIAHTALENEVITAISVSIYCALVATLIALIFGVPLSYVLARHDFYGKGFIEAIIDVPVVIPHTVSGIALLTVFAPRGLLGPMFNKIGLVFVDSMPGIIIAMLFVSVPFMINSVREGFESVDPKLEKVARTLGASSFKTFFTITLPLTIRNIAVGCIMTWARAISEFGAVIVLAYYPMIAPTLIYDRFVNFGLNSARPVAVVLILICLAVFIIMRALIGEKR